MHLKSLVLKGFKSFADRSVLALEPGIIAVVGPNGSGKSNISDAVLWVLGERNAKHLRGQAMEDVIFAGSSARKSVGIAEVDLVLDNSDGTLPVDFDEVAVTRRMYRSGESEYLINGVVARRMDVLDILHDSGLGTGTHSIISQGSLDSILQSKPEDRRALIEEAAGVLKHKQRKAKSERKRAAMDAHLARVRDVASEVERQLDVFETSSPSYPLMASLDGCTRWLAEEGSAAFAAWRARLDRFDAAVKDLQKTKVMCFGRDALDAHPCFFAHDSGKILLQIGTEGAAYLRADGFEPEMVCGPNVLAMTSPCDEENALDRLAVVLHAWDEQAVPPAPAAHILPPPGAARCTIAEALLRPARTVPLADAAGETAAEYIWAYPPGVPLLAPGEEVTPEFLAACRELEAAGTRLKHIGGSGKMELRVMR